MKDLAPNITRLRFILEGFYDIDVDEEVIRKYFETITQDLQLRMYGEPIIFSPGGDGKEENQGYDAFVPLIDSGISLYVWSNAKFISVVIYTCKTFDTDQALETTKKFFEVKEMESMKF